MKINVVDVMGAQSNAPIIIKRKKVVAGGGHHGGAWKVAYADFVTAMMAFFMLMWLLNATTEQQRKGIADYFSPTLPINRISGGGEGMFGGTNIFTDQTLAQDGTGVRTVVPSDTPTEGGAADAAQEAAQVAALLEIEELLVGRGGESLISDQALRHVITRLTDEGLVVEIFALQDAPLFYADTSLATPVTQELTQMFARVFSLVENNVAVEGHLQSRPIVLIDNPVWDMSMARAASIRLLLESGGLEPPRFARITGHADRSPAVTDPFALRNDRIEIILLRTPS
ncbi:MAG: chemotaxis protein MotB [Paracoccaceae bacterium]